MPYMVTLRRIFVLLVGVASLPGIARAEEQAESRQIPLQYNDPDLVVDLAVGLVGYPLPMDYDGDGDMDLLVAATDTIQKGLYFFENKHGAVHDAVFEPAVRIGEGERVRLSYVDGKPYILGPKREPNVGWAYTDFKEHRLEGGEAIEYEQTFHHDWGAQWAAVDYDADGLVDLVVGNHDMKKYGWDDNFDEFGRWKADGHHGYFFLLKNTGTNDAPIYAKPQQIIGADGQPLETYGMAGPCFGDWDGDGDLDIISGQFADTLVYFENRGSRSSPSYTPAQTLRDVNGPIRFPNQMLWPTAVDWDGDGDTDLLVGQEDGRIGLLEYTGQMLHGQPAFRPLAFLKQRAQYVNLGALVTPTAVDWDGDGDTDLICGNSAGELVYLENLDGGDPPRWAAPRALDADGQRIRIQAGEGGSIQGPGEASWGYTVPCAADWNHDGLPDLVVNSIWGQVVWFENVGTRQEPRLRGAQAIEVRWPDQSAPKPEWYWWSPGANTLVTQWRTTPFVIDLDQDGLNDLVMLDHEGYLAWFRRQSGPDGYYLLPGSRIFTTAEEVVEDGNRRKMKARPGDALRLKDRKAGWSGRRKLVLTDWDLDGKLDLLINNRNIDFMRNVSAEPGGYAFKREGQVDPRLLAGHTMAPTIVDWDRDGVGDLVVGAEDGRLYYQKNPYAKSSD